MPSFSTSAFGMGVSGFEKVGFTLPNKNKAGPHLRFELYGATTKGPLAGGYKFMCHTGDMVLFLGLPSQAATVPHRSTCVKCN